MRRASAAKRRPTSSDCGLDAAAELGERLLGGEAGAESARLRRGAGDGRGHQVLLDAVLPQTAQATRPAPISRSKSAPDPNQESNRCAWSQRSEKRIISAVLVIVDVTR